MNLNRKIIPSLPIPDINDESGPMKVLHLAEVMNGGIATYLNELINVQIEELGASNIRLLGPSEHAHFLSDRVNENISVHAFKRRKRGVLALAHLVWELHKLTSNWKPDIVHAHSTFAALLIRLPGLKRSARVVYTPNSWAFSMPANALRKTFYVMVERVMAKRADAIAAVSKNEHDIAAANGIRAGRMEVIYTGIEHDRSFRPKSYVLKSTTGSDQTVTIIMVARFVAQKRHDDLIAALSRLTHLKWRLLLVGDGERLGVIKSLVAKYQITDKVEFLGLRSDVDQLLRQSDIFVMTSLYEGLPLSLLEAMRMGLPVLTNNVDANGEAILEGICGYLVPSGDIDSLADRLALLIQDPVKRKEFGEAARVRFVECFTAERMGRQMCQLYNDLLDQEA